MSTETIFEQYKQAKEVTERLASQLYSAFMSLETVEEKFKLVLDYGDEFLREERYYCPHIRLKDGSEVSLYDDLYVERHQTLALDSLTEDLLSDLEVEWDDSDEKAMILKVYVEAINQDTPAAAIVRDMLKQGIRSGRWDW